MPKPLTKNGSGTKTVKAGVEVNVPELLGLLDAVSPGLSKKSLVEHTTQYTFAGGRIITYNDKISVSVPYDRIKQNFCVRGEDFYKILKGIKEETAQLQIRDNIILIESSTTEAELTISVDESKVVELYEALNISAQKVFTLSNPAEFLEALDFCRFTASKDRTADTLFCVYVNGNSVISSDDIRVSMYDLKESVQSMLIPAEMLGELTDYPIDSYAPAESWTHFFTTNGVCFSCRTIDDEYPDVVSLVEQVCADNDSIEVPLPSSIKEVLDSMIPMCKGDTDMEKQVLVSYKKKEIVFLAEKESGKLKKTLPFDFGGKELSFTINPLFLKEILGTCDKFFLLAERGLIHFTSGAFNHIIAVTM